MLGSRLLDTNILIPLRAGDADMQARVSALDAAYVSSVSVGELVFGAYKSARVEESLAKLENILQGVAVLPCDTSSAYFYGQIKDHLRRVGGQIPDNDIWIAAVAMQYGLTIVTRDAHFNYVPGLTLERW